MGQSVETRVRVHEIHPRTRELTYADEEYPDDVQASPLSKKAFEALRDVEPGDIVEVVWDYDIERPGYYYPIVKAKRITGSLEARVETLEREVRDLKEALAARRLTLEEMKDHG